MGEPSYVEQHRFGRVGRIPTPTPFAGLGDINSYLILPRPGGAGPVLVDTGVHGDRAWAALGAGLKEFGFGVEDLELILLTHAHPDHCGQAGRIARAAGCEVWIHEDAHRTLRRFDGPDDAERLRSIETQMRQFGVPEEELGNASFSRSRSEDTFKPFEPDRLLVNGDRIELDDFALEVVHTPGHCPEEVIYWQPDGAAILSGDHLLPNITPICLMNTPDRPGGERVSAMLQYRDSLARAEDLPARITFPSHGDVIPDHRALIASYRLHTETRSLKLQRLLGRGEATVFELASAMFPRVWREQLFLVLSEAIGHLDLLEADGLAVAEPRDGVLRYRLTGEAPGAPA